MKIFTFPVVRKFLNTLPGPNIQFRILRQWRERISMMMFLETVQFLPFLDIIICTLQYAESAFYYLHKTLYVHQNVSQTLPSGFLGCVQVMQEILSKILIYKYLRPLRNFFQVKDFIRQINFLQYPMFIFLELL